MSPIDWNLFANHIRHANRILLCSHVRPDGDSIGSEMAMAEILRTLGKEVRIVNAHKTSPPLKFIDPDDTIKELKSLGPSELAWIDTIDLFIVLDTSSWAQLGEMGAILKRTGAKKIILDHHIPGDEIPAERFTDTTAEATGSLVFQAAAALGVKLTKHAAESIFVAIATDTGWFRFASVTAETYRTIAALVDCGVIPAEMYKKTHEQESLGRIRLMGRTLSNTESHLDGRFMLTRIMLSDFAETGALPTDSEDIVNMTLQVGGSRFAIIMVEQQSSAFKLSFRSRCEIDCSVMANKFQGGGHKNAAGGLIELPYEKAKATLIAAVAEAFEH